MQSDAAVLPSAATLASWEKKQTTGGVTYPPLGCVTKPTVETEAAAYYLNRKPQTLRAWACFDTGPLKPIRIGTRLAWPVAELRRLCGLEEMTTQ